MKGCGICGGIIPEGSESFAGTPCLCPKVTDKTTNTIHDIFPMQTELCFQPDLRDLTAAVRGLTKELKKVVKNLNELTRNFCE